MTEVQDWTRRLEQAFGNADYSMRRYFVDSFLFREASDLPPGTAVLEIGGGRTKRRGLFDIGRFDLRVVSVDLSPRKEPDVVADAAALPFHEGHFGAVICTEVLEHVSAPKEALTEMLRVIDRGGLVLICVPFMFRMHSDPYDYGRYTNQYWRRILSDCHLRDFEVESQGMFWSVLADMLRELAAVGIRERWPRSRLAKRMVGGMLTMIRRKAIAWDARPGVRGHPYLSNYTTGFGIRGRQLTK